MLKHFSSRCPITDMLILNTFQWKPSLTSISAVTRKQWHPVEEYPLRDYQIVLSPIFGSPQQIWQLIPANCTPILYSGISVTSLILLLTARDPLLLLQSPWGSSSDSHWGNSTAIKHSLCLNQQCLAWVKIPNYGCRAEPLRAKQRCKCAQSKPRHS